MTNTPTYLNEARFLADTLYGGRNDDDGIRRIEAALVSAYNAGVENAAVESEKAFDAILGGGPIYTGGGIRALKLPGAP